MKCQNIGARLFEPKTKAQNDEVATIVEEILQFQHYTFWIGITRKDAGWTYLSDGSDINFENWHYGNYQ